MISLRWQRGPRRFGRPELFALFGAAAGVAAFVWPHLPKTPLAGLLGCNFRQWTGWPCGSCGFTRAFVRAAHLDLSGAFVVSPLGTLLFFAMAICSAATLVTWLVPSLPRPSPVAPVGGRVATWGLVAVFVANWAYLLLFRFITGACPA